MLAAPARPVIRAICPPANRGLVRIVQWHARVNPHASRAYFASPVWVQDLLVSGYGLRLRHLRYGAEQRRTLEQLRSSQWLSEGELELLQLDLLSGVLTHARDTVPFYADRLPAEPLLTLDDLRRVPVLRKSDVRAAGRAMLSRPFLERRLEVIHTGGTTGSPMAVFGTRTVLQRNYAFFARFREWAGVPPGARVATFAGRAVAAPAQRTPPYWRHNLAAHTLLFSSYHLSPDTVPEYVAELERFRPVLIDSYPSSIEPIARYVRDHGIDTIRPQAVITSSETLEPSVRRLIREAFGSPVFDHYGAAEMAAFITQCPAGAYHVNPEFGVVEILRDGAPVQPGELGEIVATGFINPVMPFIRYATGDLAVQAEGTCSCGRAFPMVARIVGRADDVLVTPEGRRVGRLDPIFKAVSTIVETRIVQDRADHVRVETVTHGPLSADEERTLLRELRDRLGPAMRIDVVRVPRLERTAGGKLRSVVNLVGVPDTTPADPERDRPALSVWE